uniref:Reverse transcriptase domain-containing protein n=1 Tax=Amphimedon queenslandica TaxID=400682 RepID=A0A1X7TKV2_AMPQE
MESKRAGRLKKMSKYKLLEMKYNIKRKGFQVILEELKQRLVAKSGKVRRYEQRIKQYTQNCLFNSNQKRFYQQLDGGIEKEGFGPDAKQSVSFWKRIWGTAKDFNQNATWLREIEEGGTSVTQDNLSIGIGRVMKKMPSWKTPGPDGVQGFWIKNVTALHKSIASQFDKCAKTNPIYALLILNMASCLQRYTKCVITFVTRSEFSTNKIKK